MVNKMLVTAVAGSLLTLGGCSVIGNPRMRPGSYFGSCFSGTDYVSIENLGNHSSKFSLSEKKGMIYTSHAGYIDVGHLRESADRTKYAAELTLENLVKGKNSFNFKIIEPVTYHTEIELPNYIKNMKLDEKKKILKNVSIDLGQYFAHQSLIWHEIITWFGYASTGFFSEQPSSFSWEDSYSDLLGTKLGAEALREGDFKNYDKIMTKNIKNELVRLGDQDVKVAKHATEIIKGKWYNGGIYPFVEMKKRNFDIGMDDGFITPWLVPGIKENSVPFNCPAPNLDSVRNKGIKVKFEMYPREFEANRIFKIVGSKDRTIYPEKDFPKIIRWIVQDAKKKYGDNVDKPTLK